MDSNSYGALRERAAWIDLSGRGKIRATGEDRVRLMHSMTTNDIQSLVPGEGCYTFFLSPQGRILADANVFSMPDHLLIDTEPETKQRVFDHLEKFIIADDVILHDFTKDYATINVEGAGAEEMLRDMQLPAARLRCSIAEWEHCDVARVSYTGQPGYSIFVPCEHLNDLTQRLERAGIIQADTATADVVRIENARPRYGVDFSDSNIPQETHQMHAVHPSKGCYIGQEIVERVRSRGHVNRLLVALEIETKEAPSPGSKIEAASKEAGSITSATYSPMRDKVVALGFLRNEAMNAALTVAGATASVRQVTS